MLKTTCDNVRCIFEIYELTGTLKKSVFSLPRQCLWHSPKLEFVGTASNEFDVVEVLMFIDSEVASANAAHPVGSSFARNYRCKVSGIKCGNTNLCNELGITFISFNINTDKDDGGFLRESNKLAGIEGRCRR